jgi:GPH family glycoside/pentoside/hexuronide:cation symporter
MKDIKILSRGFFEKPFMRSRITTNSMTTKEKILGYLVGPMGLTIFIATITQLIELYYTSVFYIDEIFGNGTYLTLTVVGRIVGILGGIGLSWLIDHTVSSQGKIRPYVLIGSLLAVISGFCMFWIPEIGNIGKLIWVFVSYTLYNGIALTCYMTRGNLITLSTRNYKDRTTINLFSNMSNFLLAGVAVGLVVSSVIYYIFLYGHPATNWYLLVGIAAIIALPLLFVEYYFTKERLTIEDREINEAKGGIKLIFRDQLKALLKNKMWVLAFLMTTITLAANSMKGTNTTTNYCQWVLGANAQNNYQLYYQIVSGVPMGIGILLIYPLSRKYGIKPVTLASNLIYIVGALVGFIAPADFTAAIVSGFIMNMGNLANIYIFSTLTVSAMDSVEHKCGHRLEGSVAVGILVAAQSLILSPFSGLYETMLNKYGYDPINLSVQPQAVQNWIIFCFYGVSAIALGIICVLLIFYSLEKELPKIHADLLERRKAAVLARGEQWIEPEERERLEAEENARLAEEARVTDLQERCKRKGLDFDKENRKYLLKLERRSRK